jgi:predicted dehydrogenase
MKLGFKNILAYDALESRRIEVKKNYPVTVFQSFNDSLLSKSDIMIISTPPDQHLKFAKIAIKKNIPFFTEVNLILNHVEKILSLQKKSFISSPSYTMHFHPVIKELKKLIKHDIIGKPLIIHHHAGQFLPDWHPWEDYRKFFVSKKNTGGAKEILYMELSWLTYLFNGIKIVMGNVQKISKLDANIDDIYQVILKFKNNLLCTMTIDVLSIPAFRDTKIIGEKGTITCNFNSGAITIFQGKKIIKKSIQLGHIAKGYSGSVPPEKMYEEELKNFFSSLKHQKKYSYTFREELELLRVIDAIKKSSSKKKQIILR